MTQTKPPTPAAARRRGRVQLIRRRTAATALAIFVLAFGLISATGSMGAAHKASSAQQRQAAGSSSSGSAGTTTQSQPSSGAGQSSPAPVTTQQS